jgi:formate dehydrogenase major subunit
MSRRARVLDELDPRAHAFFNPIDLAQRGIESGTSVRLVSRRGAIDLLAFPDPGLAKGVVFAPFCFTEAPANTIANPALDPRSKNAEMKVAAVRLEALPVNAHTSSNEAPKETASESG